MIDLVVTADSYKYYRQNNPSELYIPILDYKQGFPVYRKITSGLMDFMMDKVLEGFDVRLGAKLGVIGIRGKKIEPIIVKDKDGNDVIRGIAPDWGATHKLQASNPEAKEKRTRVFCFNEHSNGIKYQFFWAKEQVKIHNKQFYSFTFMKTNKRKLTKAIKEQGKEYLIKDKKFEYEHDTSEGED